MKVGFISLGCSKNLIDTEIAIGHFKNNNYEIVNNPAEAEVIVINTCGFIESAKEEAINTILEMAEYKKKKCKYLIVIKYLIRSRRPGHPGDRSGESELQRAVFRSVCGVYRIFQTFSGQDRQYGEPVQPALSCAAEGARTGKAITGRHAVPQRESGDFLRHPGK